MVHVSTAYSNCPNDVIEEKIYDFPMSYQDIASIIEKYSDTEITTMTPGYVCFILLLSNIQNKSEPYESPDLFYGDLAFRLFSKFFNYLIS